MANLLKPKNEIDNQPPKRALYYGGILALTVAISIGLYSLHDPGKIGGTYSNYGEFIGGIVGSLLSFAGILLLMQTIKDQQYSIRISQKALLSQSEELQATRRIHQEQQFGSIFFQLLSTYNELVKSFETINPLSETVSGKKCLKLLHDDFLDRCEAGLGVDAILEKYKQFVDENPLSLVQFNQNLEMVLSITMEYDLEFDLKKKYSGFISAQLSYHEEFFLLMYLAAYPQAKFSKEEMRKLKMFDFKPEIGFEFLSEFN